MTAPDEKGLLSSLPNRRPAVETPRRAKAREQAARARAAEPEPAAAPPAESSGSGLEQLARTGAGLVGGAASAGLRLAGRALGGLGKAVGRGS